MKKTLLLFLIIGFFSCSKNKTESDDPCPDYVKGEVVVGIKNTTSIENVFSKFNQLNLQIDEMNGFFYTSPYPQDSLTSLITFLNTKSYTNTRDFSASAFIHYQTGIINITTIFFDMDVNNQQDWISTEKSLDLIDTKSDTKNIVLKVPVGQEEYWLNNLKTNSMVTWTELNCIGQYQLL